MNIELHEIVVRDLVADYEDRGDEGVVGYGGRRGRGARSSMRPSARRLRRARSTGTSSGSRRATASAPWRCPLTV